MQQDGSTRTSQASVSAALAAANAALRDLPSMHLGRPNSGRSLADMAQRDLDAALQLLTDRAQYITGSSGAAIALRRSGTNDMLCRASTGSNAPELGTLLSTEFGLSGESVRTRRALRCDDVERDARVNHDICREVGIASVVVMPVVHDDEVLGVFELFSGKVHAFGERDMSALQRLSEMVETAVRLAQAAQDIPERFAAATPAAVAVEREDEILETQLAGDLVIEEPVVEEPIIENDPPAIAAASAAGTPAIPEPVAAKAAAVAATAETARTLVETRGLTAAVTPPASPISGSDLTGLASASPVAPVKAAAAAAPARKPMLWSAATSLSADARRAAEADQSHVPPAFRNLRKCEACGFPVSAERRLCVECEEKKWRGQLKPRTAASSSTMPVQDSKGIATEPRLPVATVSSALAAPAVGPKVKPQEGLSKPVSSTRALSAEAGEALAKSVPTSHIQSSAARAAVTGKAPGQVQAKTQDVPAQQPTFVLTAALAPTQSWLGRNKYILGALIVVAGSVAAVLLLR